MRKHLKDYFIPHHGNDHKPHMVRDVSVIAIATTLVLVFGFSVFQALLVRTSTEFTAAVLPSVLVDLANEDREAEGLGGLTVSPVLEEAARMKAEDMAENSYFAHTSPAGLNPWYWFYRAGYDFIHAGENLAVNFVDSEDVNQAWLDSPGHRANILNGNFTEIGIAAVSGEYKGKKTIFVVQLFGTPAQAAPVAVAPVVPADEGDVAGEQVVAEVAVESEPVIQEETEQYREVTLAQEFAPAQEDVTAGAQAEEITEKVSGQKEAVSQASMWQELLLSPRAIVKVAYIIIGLLLALVILLMVLKQVHRRHSREFTHAVALVVLIALLFYFNYLLLSAELLVV